MADPFALFRHSRLRIPNDRALKPQCGNHTGHLLPSDHIQCFTKFDLKKSKLARTKSVSRRKNFKNDMIEWNWLEKSFFISYMETYKFRSGPDLPYIRFRRHPLRHSITLEPRLGECQIIIWSDLIENLPTLEVRDQNYGHRDRC